MAECLVPHLNVNRRVGGLEGKGKWAHGATLVNRRVGGLEDQPLQTPDHQCVNRRVGGLEASHQ